MYKFAYPGAGRVKAALELDNGVLLSVDAAAGRLRTATYIVLATSILVAATVTIASGVRVSARGTEDVGCMIAFLLLVSAIHARQGIRVRLADTLSTFALNWLGGYVCVSLAVAGLYLRFPLADPMFRSADLFLGVDGLEIVRAEVRQGQWLFSLMAAAYAYTIPLVLLSTATLILIGRRLEAWRACFCFNATLLTAAVISVFLPAKGLGSWFDPELIKRLPANAGTYFYQTFDNYYSGPDPQLSIYNLNGVISFPSFHMIMGLIVLAMWRKWILTLAIAALWLAVMVLSTFCYGGHYLVDLICGLADWAGWFWLSFHIERGFRSANARQDATSMCRHDAASEEWSDDDALAA